VFLALNYFNRAIVEVSNRALPDADRMAFVPSAFSVQAVPGFFGKPNGQLSRAIDAKISNAWGLVRLANRTLLAILTSIYTRQYNKGAGILPM